MGVHFSVYYTLLARRVNALTTGLRWPHAGLALSLPLSIDNRRFLVTTYYSNICPNGVYFMAPKGKFPLSPHRLAELAEQPRHRQLEILSWAYEQQERNFSVRSVQKVVAASCALERSGREIDLRFTKTTKQMASPKVMQKQIPDIDQLISMTPNADGAFTFTLARHHRQPKKWQQKRRLLSQCHIRSRQFPIKGYSSGISGNAARLRSAELSKCEPAADVQLGTPGVAQERRS